jgi:hypothetical protein
MEYRELVDISNLVISVLQGAMGRMGLSSELILAQVKDHMESKDIQDTFAQHGLKVDGSDIKSVTDSWVGAVKKIGAAQRVIIEDVGDSKVVVDIGECVFAPATQAIRGNDKETIPPCPFIAMLTAALEVNTGKTANVDRCEWKPELNTSIFTISLE